MKFEGEKLQVRLRRQRVPVDLLDVDGRERRKISPSYVADWVRDKAFIGYGKNGTVHLVKAAEAPRRSLFIASPDIQAVLKSFPRQSTATRSRQVRQGGLKWKPQPADSRIPGGGFSTVHFNENRGSL